MNTVCKCLTFIPGVLIGVFTSFDFLLVSFIFYMNNAGYIKI
jgi:hypothetical protein